MNAKKEQPPNYTGLPEPAQQQQRQQGTSTGTNGYPGNQGGSVMNRDAVVYDPTTGQPMLSNVTAQRQQIEASLGPVCSEDNGYHTLRMHYTTKSLLFSILIIPYCCGYRGRRVVRLIAVHINSGLTSFFPFVCFGTSADVQSVDRLFHRLYCQSLSNTPRDLLTLRRMGHSALAYCSLCIVYIIYLLH